MAVSPLGILLLTMLFASNVVANLQAPQPRLRNSTALHSTITSPPAACPTNALGRRQDDLQTVCGYSDGVESGSRDAASGFVCTTETGGALWGFCASSAYTARQCTLAEVCVDYAECSSGCGYLNGGYGTTFTCGPGGNAPYCTSALLIDQADTYLYLGCGPTFGTDILYATFTTSSTSSSSLATSTPTPAPAVASQTTIQTSTPAASTALASTNTQTTSPTTSSSLASTTSATSLTLGTISSAADTSSPASASSASGSSSGSATTPSPSPTPSKTNIGAIVGGVVGGVAFLVLLAALFFFLRRRRSSRVETEVSAPHEREPMSQPSELEGSRGVFSGARTNQGPAKTFVSSNQPPSELEGTRLGSKLKRKPVGVGPV